MTFHEKQQPSSIKKEIDLKENINTANSMLPTYLPTYFIIIITY